MSRPIPKSLFSRGLDEVGTKWLKNRTDGDPRQFMIDVDSARLKVAEALVFSPRVTFRVYGENVVLAQLVAMFGVAGVERLLEDGAVDFVLWRSMTLHMTNNLRNGLRPLMGGELQTTPHVDPDASNTLGLNWVGGSVRVGDQDRKRLVRLANDRMTVTPIGSGQRAVDLVSSAYEKGLLGERGLPGLIAMWDLPMADIERLSLLAGHLMEAEVAVAQGFDVHENEEAWAAMMAVCADLRTKERALQVTQEVLALEGLPSIPTLLLQNQLSLANIVDLRSRRETEEFRKWFWSRESPEDASKISAEYVASMAPSVDLKDRALFKTIRVCLITAISTALGVAAGGGVIAGAVVGLAASFADAFWLETLASGVNPRRLATNVLRPMVAAHAAARSEAALATLQRRASVDVPVHVETPLTHAVDPVVSPEAARKKRNKRKAEKRARAKNRGR